MEYGNASTVYFTPTTGACRPARVLIVSWRGGGASQPAIGLGRLLAARHHDVRLIGPASFARRVTSAGCRHRPIPAELEFEAGERPTFEEQPEYAMELFFGPRLPTFVAGELEREPADVVVVDYLLRSTASLAETLATPTVLLTHMAFGFSARPVDDSEEAWSPRWQYGLVNDARARLGLAPLSVGPDPLSVALGKRADAVMVTITAELDPWPDPPRHVVHVGPITEEATGGAWSPPWPRGKPRPLVVISMSTMYMRHEPVLLEAARGALATGARVLVLSGLELCADQLPLPPGVAASDYVPHAAVLPYASLVITHGGIGTLMAAFSAGVPAICLPLGRDQHVNAARARELGAATVLSHDAPAAEIEREIRAALSSSEMRRAAERMAESVKAYGGGARAVEIVESLGRRTRDVHRGSPAPSPVRT
jgi:MGT family glycosyltransferase